MGVPAWEQLCSFHDLALFLQELSQSILANTNSECSVYELDGTSVLWVACPHFSTLAWCAQEFADSPGTSPCLEPTSLFEWNGLLPNNSKRQINLYVILQSVRPSNKSFDARPVNSTNRIRKCNNFCLSDTFYQKIQLSKSFTARGMLRVL